MRSDKYHRLTVLLQLVEKDLAEAPFEYDGILWARYISQSALAECVGYSLATVERLLGEPPIQRLCIKDPETKRKVTLLRLGEKVTTDTDLVRIMVKLARDAGAVVERKHYGMFRGMVTDWPAGAQLEILKCALGDWPAFMAGVHFIVDELKAAGTKAEKRYYKHPAIGVLYRFRGVALDLYTMKLQAAGNLKALARLPGAIIPAAA